MEPLRVAVDVGPLAAPRTGIGNAVAAMIAALGLRDDVACEPYLLSFRARPDGGVRRLPLPAAFAHRLWARADHPRADRWLAGADVVHGTNYVVPPLHLPGVVSVYDCWFLRHPELASPTVRRFGRLVARAVRRGATVHACSQATADAVTELLPGARVRVVHLAALPLAPAAAIAPLPDLAGRPYVLSVGTLERRKNLPTLVEAFGMLATEQPDVQLVLAGAGGDDRPAVEAAIDRLGAATAARVLVTGRIDEPSLAWLVHNATAVAYPSLDEGFGFPLLDAMQAGVPVVASTAGSIPEVAGDAALLCPPTDTTGLAAALATALTDTTVRARLVAAGAAQWQRWSWEGCAAGLADVYRDAVEAAR
jgi:glycosyltransferase involved in cell wall biosynthesis